MNKFIENLKKDPVSVLRFGLAVVFLLAGLHRIFFFEMAKQNFIELGLIPASFLVGITILVELIVSISFFVNRYVVASSWMILALLTIGISASIVKLGTGLFTNIHELFLLTYTPTNIVMHTTYFMGIIAVLFTALGKKK